jgi:hypothetical protein
MEKKSFDQGKKSSMTRTRITKLEEAGFIWAKPKGVDAWEERFEELQHYRDENGDPNVPTKYPNNRPLGRWVSTQRSMYKQFHSGGKFHKLPREEIERRISLLESMGFSWNLAPIKSFSREDFSLLRSGGIGTPPTSSSAGDVNSNESQYDGAADDDGTGRMRCACDAV